jgi:hypothetical protein
MGGHTVAKIVSAMIEWLDMKLQDDAVRREVESTVLSVDESDKTAALRTVILSKLTETKDQDRLGAVIGGAYAALAEIRPVVDAAFKAGDTQEALVETLIRTLSSGVAEVTPPAG